MCLLVCCGAQRYGWSRTCLQPPTLQPLQHLADVIGKELVALQGVDLPEAPAPITATDLMLGLRIDTRILVNLI